MVMSRAQTAPSGCNETRKQPDSSALPSLYKVTLAITNANNSRVNIPIAKVDGYHMDWFECRDGAWYCKNRHGRITLDNSNGARDRLTFHYDQVEMRSGRRTLILKFRQSFARRSCGENSKISVMMSHVTVR